MPHLLSTTLPTSAISVATHIAVVYTVVIIGSLPFQTEATYTLFVIIYHHSRLLVDIHTHYNSVVYTIVLGSLPHSRT